ncbi:MAG: hypothetical protein JO112_05375 [Planctomycetes bacterium]|nr:hypothetical protein [Planctomycetota bacterium]
MYIVEITTREGQVCESFCTYEEARRRVELLPVENLISLPLIFEELPDGSQRLVREDGKPLQWHRLPEDPLPGPDEPIPLSDEPPPDLLAAEIEAIPLLEIELLGDGEEKEDQT